MKAKLKRLLPLFFSIGLLGVMILLPTLQTCGNGTLENNSEDSIRNANEIDDLSGSGGSSGFGGVYDTNIIHKYENSSDILVTQNNNTLIVPKPICDNSKANITTSAVQFDNYTLIGEDNDETGSYNIQYSSLFVSSITCITPSILSKISVLMVQNGEENNYNGINIRVYGQNLVDLLYQSDIITISLTGLYNVSLNLNLNEGIYYLGIYGSHPATNCNWSYTSDLSDGDNNDESTAYKWNGSGWDLLPVDFHFNVTLSPLIENPTPSQAGLTINGKSVDDTGIWTYEGTRNATEFAIDFQFSCDWYNWSVRIDSLECEFVTGTSMVGFFSVQSGATVVWELSGSVIFFDESYTGPGITHILEWIIPSSWCPYQYENSSGSYSDFEIFENASNKMVRVKGFNGEWRLFSYSNNILSSIAAQINAQPVSVVRSQNSFILNVSSLVPMSGEIRLEIRDQNSVLKYNEEKVASGSSVISWEINVYFYLGFEFGDYTIRAIYWNKTDAGFVESEIAYIRSVFHSVYPPNNTAYMPLPFTVNLSFMDIDYSTPVPQGWIVAYSSPAGSGQTLTDGFGNAQILLDGGNLQPGNYSMLATLQESSSGPIVTEVNYTFQIIRMYPNLYEEGKCRLHINNIEFKLTSLSNGLNLGKEYLWFSENRSWAEITIHFDMVRPGTFNSYDGFKLDGTMKIGTSDNPKEYSTCLNLYIKLEDILPWGSDHYLYMNKPFSVTFLYYCSEKDFKAYDYFITWCAGFSTMQWQYVINTQTVNLDLNAEQFIYRIDDAELYNWGWIRAHQELFMLITFPIIGALLFFGYRPYLKYHLNRQLKEQQAYLDKLLKAGLEPTFEAYLAEHTIEPKRRKLERLQSKGDPEPLIPELEDQLANAHPSERHRFYIEGVHHPKQIKRRGLVTGLLLFAFSIMIVNGLALYFKDTKFMLPTGVPFLNAIVLMGIYGLVLIISIRIGMWLSLPPKTSVRKFSEHILNLQKQMIERQQDSDTPKELFSIQLMEQVDRILKEAEEEDRLEEAKKSAHAEGHLRTRTRSLKKAKHIRKESNTPQYKVIIGWSMVIGLIIPMIFLHNLELIISETSPLNYLLFITIGVACAIIGYIVLFKLPNSNQRDMLARHKVISAIHRKDIRYLALSFFCSMILEEVIFRYYLTGILLFEYFNRVDAILISAGIFAAFHGLQYLKFPSMRLITIWMGIALILGIYLGFVFAECGWMVSLIAHGWVVLVIYGLLARNIPS